METVTVCAVVGKKQWAFLKKAGSENGCELGRVTKRLLEISRWQVPPAHHNWAHYFGGS
jgi:hypothetical protein